jgi:hypothetical protein
LKSSLRHGQRGGASLSFFICRSADPQPRAASFLPGL